MAKSESTPDILPYGDHGLLVQYQVEGFSAHFSDRIHALANTLRTQDIWREIVPAYDSLVVTFDLAAMPVTTAVEHLRKAMKQSAKTDSAKIGKLIEVPVHYGGKAGPDMDTICESSKLSQDEVIKLHSAKPYRVCMMGFIPGFTFLSAAPKQLHHPRLKTPRAKVAAGSVGIANWQTGIYGLESPGGWQIIGRTPLQIFDKLREDPFLIKAGDRVKFVPTSGDAS